MTRQHVLVTGASRGIGAAIVQELSAHWPQAVFSLVARNREALEALEAEDPARRGAFPADLSDPAVAEPLVAQAEQRWGPVDVLIDNAGLYLAGPSERAEVEAFERLLAVNLRTPWRLVRAVLPAMCERRSGVIVEVASVAAFAPVTGTPHYSGSKAALAAAAEALHAELRPRGVHVLTVYPGPIHTDMGAQAQRALGGGAATRLVPWGTPEGLARRVRRGIERRRRRVIYPAVYAITRHLPGLTHFLLARFGPDPAAAAS